MSNMKPSEWCRKMSEEAKDGKTAYNYHQMAEDWKQKEDDLAGVDVLGRKNRPCSD